MDRKLRFLCSLILASAALALAGPANADLKCPFTGSPPNFDCPPSPQNPPPPPPDFKDVDFDDNGTVNVEIPALAAATEAGGAMEVAVVVPAAVVPVGLRILDWHTGRPLPGMEAPRFDRMVSMVYGDGLPIGGSAADAGRATRDPRALEATGYVAFSRLAVRPGTPLRIEVTLALVPGVDLGPTGIANLLAGNARIVSGERGPEANIGVPRRWELLAVLRRAADPPPAPSLR